MLLSISLMATWLHVTASMNLIVSMRWIWFYSDFKIHWGSPQNHRFMCPPSSRFSVARGMEMLIPRRSQGWNLCPRPGIASEANVQTSAVGFFDLTRVCNFLGLHRDFVNSHVLFLFAGYVRLDGVTKLSIAFSLKWTNAVTRWSSCWGWSTLVGAEKTRILGHNPSSWQSKGPRSQQATSTGHPSILLPWANGPGVGLNLTFGSFYFQLRFINLGTLEKKIWNIHVCNHRCSEGCVNFPPRQRVVNRKPILLKRPVYINYRAVSNESNCWLLVLMY